MLADPVPGLYDHEVEPQPQSRHRRSIGQRPAIDETVGGGADPSTLPVVHGLLRQAEVASRAPTNLDEHKRLRRTRVDRHDVKLMAADMDVPGQDRPPETRQAIGNQRLGNITGLLGGGALRATGWVCHLPHDRRRPLPATYLMCLWGISGGRGALE